MDNPVEISFLREKERIFKRNAPNPPELVPQPEEPTYEERLQGHTQQSEHDSRLEMHN